MILHDDLIRDLLVLLVFLGTIICRTWTMTKHNIHGVGHDTTPMNYDITGTCDVRRSGFIDAEVLRAALRPHGKVMH